MGLGFHARAEFGYVMVVWGLGGSYPICAALGWSLGFRVLGSMLERFVVYGFRGFRVNVQINQFGRQVLDLGFHVYRGMERRLGFEV